MSLILHNIRVILLSVVLIIKRPYIFVKLYLWDVCVCKTFAAGRKIDIVGNRNFVYNKNVHYDSNTVPKGGSSWLYV